MSCFSVTDPFLTFYYVEKKKESYLRIGGGGLKNLTYPYMGVRGGQKLPKSSLHNY